MAQELLTATPDGQSAADGFMLIAAPLQGYTEAPFRHFHSEIYGGAGSLTYFSPFVRVEKGEPRPRDMRDATSPLNANHRLIPQIIFRDAAEFRLLVSALCESGHSRVDLNLGCPFVPQVRKGRGSGMLQSPDRLREIADIMAGEYPDIGFSVKMRLGVSDPAEWHPLMPLIDAMPLTHLTVHPRTASEQYSGPLHPDEFARIADICVHPLIFNGDITTPEMIDDLRRRFPSLAGVMIGRGLLSRPSIFAEWTSGCEWQPADRRESILRLHAAILDHYTRTLSGDTQILAKIKPLWDYFGTDFDRKTIKKLLKSPTLTTYRQNLP